MCKNEYDAHKAIKVGNWARRHVFRFRLNQFRRSYVTIDFRGIL